MHGMRYAHMCIKSRSNKNEASLYLTAVPHFLFNNTKNLILIYMIERLVQIMKKFIFCLLGKSSSGKDSIARKLLTMEFSGTLLHKIVPITSRPPRANEVSGEDYEFLTKEYFEQLIKSENSDILEYRSYKVKTIDNKDDVWYYGNRFPDIDEPYSLMIGTPEACYNALRNKTLTERECEIVPIYIDVPNEERLFRMVRREAKNPAPNYRELARRFFKDEDDFDAQTLNMVLIGKHNTFINDDFETAANEVHDYIAKMIFENERRQILK